MAGPDEEGRMHEVVVGGRSITVTHIASESSEHGAIQRYRVEVSGSDSATEPSILRENSVVDARVVASVIDSELFLEYPGSAESGLLRDSAIRTWRDEHRGFIEELLTQLKRDADALPSEPVSDAERVLLRAFEMDDRHGDA